MGDVRESARVRINGQEAGCVWAVPYQLKVGQFLKPGKNHIEIEVTNLPANRIAELDRQGVQWRKFKEINIVDLRYRPANYGHWAPMPSGLNSEVRLIPVDFTQVTTEDTKDTEPYNSFIISVSFVFSVVRKLPVVKNTGLFLYGQRNIFVVSDKKGWGHDRGVSM